MNFVIITPAKNEEKYIEFTLKSVCGQTLLPMQWIIVDDGSTDKTATLVQKYIKDKPWIKLLSNKNTQEKRMGGQKVVRAFYAGYNAIENHDYDFIVKLDADLTLPNNYFKKVASAFQEDSNIGLCGGYCVIEKNGKLISEGNSPDHLRGPIKAYRTDCFREIGGIKETLNWDGLDVIEATYLGWKIKILPIEVIHHRKTSSLINNDIVSRYLSGKEDYRFGYNLTIIFIRSILNLKKRPYITSSFIYIWGYLVAFFKQENKLLEKDKRKYANSFKFHHYMNKLKNII